MTLMSEIVGQSGAYSFLDKVYSKGDIATNDELLNLMEEIGVSNNLFSDLISSGLLIGRPEGYYISSLGKKITLLLRAINGDEEILGVFQQLRYLYPSLQSLDLITEDITEYFINSLYLRPDFVRVLICSPWIRLDEDHLIKLYSSMYKASKKYTSVQLRVISLPPAGYYDWKASIRTFKLFHNLGGEIVFHKRRRNNKFRLHTKLYIVEPGPQGGSHFAIVGSENLTGKRNKELAIKIENDNEILRKLNLYFDEIWQESEISKEV